MRTFFFATCLVVLAASAFSEIFPRENSHNPYQISLRHKSHDPYAIKLMFSFCSGAILTNEWVLTTARCVSNFDIRELEITYGTGDSKKSNGIEMKIVHPKFDRDNFVNDIAMLLTKEKIIFVPNVIAPIDLPSNAATDGEPVTISSLIRQKVCKNSSQLRKKSQNNSKI